MWDARLHRKLFIPSVLLGGAGVLTATVTRVAAADEAPVPEVRVREPQPAGFVSERRMDDASREVTDAASLVEAAPGVHVRRLGADDSFSTLSVRGTSSTEVAIYLAGVPLSGGADPTLDLATLPLWPGARARVYRSFSPASIGRGSLGGVLVLDPPNIRSEERTDVWTAIGSFGARRLRIGDVRAVGDMRVSTALSASRSDDDFTYQQPFVAGASLTRQNAGHAAVNGLASIAIPVHLGGRDGALTITTLAQSRRQELPSTVELPTYFARLDSTRLVSGLELSLPLGSGTLITRAWGRREGLTGSDSPTEAVAHQAPSYSNDTIIAGGASTGMRFRPAAGSLFDVRIDGSSERYAPGTWLGVITPPPPATRNQVGLALDTSYTLSGVRLAASSRLDETVDASDDPGVKSRSDFVPTAHVGMEGDAGPLTLAAHGGALSRPASFVERFGNHGAYIGERDHPLKPESATTVDAGARTRFAAGPVRVGLELSSFATWANDLIVFVPTGAYGRLLATNIGEARILGLEADLLARLGKGELRASYTGLATENESECKTTGAGPCEHPALVGRPAHDLVTDLAYTVGPVRARIGGDFVSGINADVGGTTIVPARFLTSAGLRLALPGALGAGSTGRTTLALDLRNLFDVRTATYRGSTGPEPVPIGDLFQYPLPGRSFLLSLRFEESQRGVPPHPL